MQDQLGQFYPAFLIEMAFPLTPQLPTFHYYFYSLTRCSGRPNIYYNNSQNQQRQPMVTTPTPAPASTFSSPLQHSTTPPSTCPQPQPQMAPLGSAFELSKPLPSPGPLSIEAQRVTALLELNSILLKEVINLQNAGKAEMPQQQQQQLSPPAEQASVIPGSEPKKEQPSTPEEKMATTPGVNQKFQVSGKVLAKDYVEYDFSFTLLFAFQSPKS